VKHDLAGTVNIQLYCMISKNTNQYILPDEHNLSRRILDNKDGADKKSRM